MDDFHIRNGDIDISNGSIVEITGAEKVAQDLKTWLLNDLAHNRFHPWLGSSLDDYVGRVPEYPHLHAIKTRVRESLNAYIADQVRELKRRVEKKGNALAAIILAEPNSIIRAFTKLEVHAYATDIIVKIGFDTFAGQSREMAVQLITGTDASLLTGSGGALAQLAVTPDPTRG